MSKKAVLFTSPGCSWCTTAKNHFRKHRVAFKEIDISKDPKAAADCQRHGCCGVPVVMIGSQWICGFDKAKINQILEIRE